MRPALAHSTSADDDEVQQRKRLSLSCKLFRFDQLPASYCHEGHLSRWDPVFSDQDLRRRLINCQRLWGPLSKRIVRHYRLEACELRRLRQPESLNALLDADALLDQARWTGALWHSRTIASIVIREERDVLIKTLGESVYALILAHSELGRVLRSGQDLGTLFREIDEDGRRCLAVWIAGQDEPVRRRLLLKLPPDPRFLSPHQGEDADYARHLLAQAWEFHDE